MLRFATIARNRKEGDAVTTTSTTTILDNNSLVGELQTDIASGLEDAITSLSEFHLFFDEMRQTTRIKPGASNHHLREMKDAICFLEVIKQAAEESAKCLGAYSVNKKIESTSRERQNKRKQNSSNHGRNEMLCSPPIESIRGKTEQWKTASRAAVTITPQQEIRKSARLKVTDDIPP